MTRAGDVENELRQAMQEHVAEAAAPRSLVHDVRQRYRRRVMRVRVVTAASVTVVAIAALPAYHALMPQQVGDREGAQVRAAGSASAVPGQPGPGASRPGSGETPGELQPRNGASVPPGATSQPIAKGDARPVLMYQPAGMRPTGPCTSYRLGPRVTTTCRWEGRPGEWVEATTVRQPGLSRSEDLPFSTLLAQIKKVHKQRAIVGDRTDGGRQALWVERNGVGVYVGVAPSLRKQLMRIAEGLRMSA